MEGSVGKRIREGGLKLPLVTDDCFTCGKPLPQKERSDFEQCRNCRALWWFLITLASVAFISLWGLTWYLGALIKCSALVLNIGLTLDIAGAWLLANGYLETMIRASAGYSATARINKQAGPNFKCRIAGLSLLIFGFVFQGISNAL
jgi:hypothetical protein